MNASINIGNPWYRQSRNGEVQGRSGAAADGKADGNAAGPNPSAPVAQAAAGSVAGK